MEQYITIGQIGAPYGIHGELKVLPLTDFPERFLKTRKVCLRCGDELQEKVVEHASLHKGMVLLKLAGIDTPEEAAGYRGVLLQVRESELCPLPEGHYYRYQIIGLDVCTEAGDLLGQVAEILDTGSNDVYLVKTGKSPEELLIPAIKEVVLKIDLEKRRMTIRPMPGLLEE